uniref:Uncharacterized protein n=1 Tax=Timema monikensis TaxID=170555 RepID=A0A7R9ELJ1_9NEOP|nr:unnamed protein product [Timema monikensis]
MWRFMKAQFYWQLEHVITSIWPAKTSSTRQQHAPRSLRC